MSLRRFGIEEFHVVAAVAVATVLVEEFVESGQSGFGLGDVEMAASDLVGVDPLPVEDPEHLVDRVEERRLKRTHGVHSAEARRTDRTIRIIDTGTFDRFGVLGSVPGHQSREPASVAAGGTVADVLGLDDGDLPIRMGPAGTVGGPEAGHSSADDDEVLLLDG